MTGMDAKPNVAYLPPVILAVVQHDVVVPLLQRQVARLDRRERVHRHHHLRFSPLFEC